MKKIFLLFTFLMVLDTQAQDRFRIQLPEKEYKVKDILDIITRQTQLSFIYQPSDIDERSIITTPEEMYDLKNLLMRMFPSNRYEYLIRDGKILIKKKRESNQTSLRNNVSGYVTDQSTGESLIGAHIIFSELSVGVVTNAYGFYSANLPHGTYTIAVGYLGYRKFEQQFEVNQDVQFNIQLSEVPNELQEVMIYSGQTLNQTSQISTIKIPVKQMSNLPVLLGESDIIKSIQLLPGVSGGIEGFSNFYVRGGGPDQNLILLDGVPLYNTQHLFGFLSTFNNDALNNVDLYKGGFPARYGGRLSSVLDIQLKEGNRNEFQGDATVGLLSSALTLEGPLNEKTSFMISGRRTYWDLVARPLLNTLDQNTSYNFHDLYAKINHKISPKNKIFFSTYLGNDKLSLENNDVVDNNSQLTISDDKNNLKWGNFISVFRWNHTFSPEIFGNIGVTYSQFYYNINYERVRTLEENGVKDAEPEIYRNSLNSGIEDVTLKADFDFFPVPNHTIKFGSQVTYHTFRPKALSTINFNNAISLFAEPIRAMETATYIEDDINLGRLDVNLGVHFASFSLPSKTYSSFQPRLSMNYRVNERLSAKLAYAEMTQFLHLLTTTTVGLPSDLWVPATENVPPQDASQVTGGLAYAPKPEFEFSLEGYYKKMDNLLEYKEGINYANINSDWQETVTTANGRSYGMEFLAQKKSGRVDGFLGYTLSWAFRQSPELNRGKEFFYRFDRRHDLSLALNFNKSKKIVYSGVWVYGSGQAVTLPEVQYINPDNELILAFSDRNEYRMPAYHRLDLSASFIKEKKKGERRWILGVYNLYARRNPFFLEYEGGVNSRFIQYSLFQFIPSISYRRNF